jgi:hypothetical protein
MPSAQSALPLPLHLLPHAPQFFVSVMMLVHWPPHRELPAAQLTPHWPSAQVAMPPITAGHVFAQPPQLFKSARGSMQALPQGMNGAWH